jgi:hypothetical protein
VAPRIVTVEGQQRRVVQMLDGFRNYAPGEVAGFKLDVAQKLIDAGVAIDHDPEAEVEVKAHAEATMKRVRSNAAVERAEKG